MRWVIDYECEDEYSTNRKDLIEVDSKQDAEWIMEALSGTGNAIPEEKYVFGNKREMCSFFCLSLGEGGEDFAAHVSDFIAEAYELPEDAEEWRRAVDALKTIKSKICFGQIEARWEKEISDAVRTLYGIDYSDVAVVNYDNVGAMLYVREFSL